MDDARLFSPSVERNGPPILAQLCRVLPPGATVLEVASGSGEHARQLALARPDLTIQPSDPGAEARASIDAWCRGLPNVRPALALDAAAWPDGLAADAVLCINMIHIAPWAAGLGLLAGAAQVLRPGGMLVLYGPFLRAGVPTAPSNLDFDADLKARDPSWGLRALEDVARAATGFGTPDVTEMPANNLLVTFTRAGSTAPPNSH